MDLTIVWRNPVSLIKSKRTLQRIRKDQFGAVYFGHWPGSHARVGRDTGRSCLNSNS
jgi:hypothetical protein